MNSTEHLSQDTHDSQNTQPPQDPLSPNNANIVIGASGGIANALLLRLLADSSDEQLIAISRQPCPKAFVKYSNLKWIAIDYNEDNIKDTIQTLRDESKNTAVIFKRVFICHGILHGSPDNDFYAKPFGPEKRLEDINSDTLHEVFHANTVVPMLWVKALRPLLAGKQACHISVLSARVGSIGDNNLGGWYAYRASKSALNMLLKTAAIEYARRAANVKLIAFHPGTTDTALSKPFQKNVPENKLFTPDFVAERLINIMNNTAVDGELAYLDWDNKIIPW